jgi:hypothetical protein
MNYAASVSHGVASGAANPRIRHVRESAADGAAFENELARIVREIRENLGALDVRALLGKRVTGYGPH